MKALIKVSPCQHNRLLAGCDLESREYSTLKNSVVTVDRGESVILLLCDLDETAALLFLASRICPDAIAAISDGLGREPDPSILIHRNAAAVSC